MNVTPWPATGPPGKGLRVEAPRAAPTMSSRGGEAVDPRAGSQRKGCDSSGCVPTRARSGATRAL